MACLHEWLLAPGGEVNGVHVCGRWVCTRCGLRGLSSLSRTPLGG